jgi:hypothetical protein
MPIKAPPVFLTPHNWSGFYLGANLRGAWSLNIPGNNLYGGFTEFIGGVQLGYNVQAGHFLFGVEGDFDGATFGHPALPAPGPAGLLEWVSSTASNHTGPLNSNTTEIFLGNWTSATVPPIQLNRDLQMVKFGANYEFETGLADTVTPTRIGHPGYGETADKRNQWCGI